jgi:AcrR family transcriptional regulator
MASFPPGRASGPEGTPAQAGPPGSAAVTGAADPGRRRRPARRLTATERRADLLEAAVTEFAARGYQGTRTADIAARAGVSQPYVYALFPDKRALFLACHDWTTERIKETLEKAGAGQEDNREPGPGLVSAYRALLREHPDQVLFQVQAHAAAAGDPAIQALVRQRFMELVELSERLSGAPRELVLDHVARAVLGNVALALDLPPDYRPR